MSTILLSISLFSARSKSAVASALCSLLLRVYSPQLPVKTAAANRLLQGFHKRRDLEAVFKVCTGNRKSHEPLTRCSRARSLSNDLEARPRARHARMNPTTEWAALQGRVVRISICCVVKSRSFRTFAKKVFVTHARLFAGRSLPSLRCWM